MCCHRRSPNPECVDVSSGLDTLSSNNKNSIAVLTSTLVPTCGYNRLKPSQRFKSAPTSIRSYQDQCSTAAAGSAAKSLQPPESSQLHNNLPQRTKIERHRAVLTWFCRYSGPRGSLGTSKVFGLTPQIYLPFEL